MQSQGFAPGEGQIELDRLSQHTATSHDPIWNAACGSKICTLASILVNSARGTLKAKRKQHVLQQISWQVQSVDLNPIELVWNELDQKVRAKTTNKCDSLLAALAEKLGRTIFSLLLVFGGKIFDNL